MQFKPTATSFSAGANESLKAVDVYKQENIAVISGVVDSSNPILADRQIQKIIPAKIGIPTGLASSIPKTVLSSPSAIVSGVIGSNPAVSDAFRSLSSVQKTMIAAGGLKSTVIATIGGITSTIQNADLTNIQGIAKMATGLAKSSIPMAFKDLTGLSTVGLNLVKESAKAGLGGVFSTFAKSDSFGGPVLNSIAISLLPMMVKKTNIPLLNEVANSAAAPYVRMYRPDLALQTLKNYKSDAQAFIKSVKSLPAEMRKQEQTLKSEWGMFKSAMTQGLDPDWNKSSRNGIVIPKTTAMKTASAQIKKTVISSSRSNAPNIGAILLGGVTMADKAANEAYLALAAKSKISSDTSTSLINEVPAAFA